MTTGPTPDPAAWGIDHGWWDVQGTWHDTDPEHVAALIVAAGEEPSAPGPPPGPPLWSVRAGTAPPLQSPAELTLEDGTTVRADTALPPDLPAGYHDLRPLDGGPTTRMIVSPGRCHLPRGLRSWGWAVQLYAARSEASWGIGDLADLGRLTRWAGGQGAGIVAINPLHAAAPVLPQQPSPYYPTSRLWRNPLLLRIEDIPGAGEVEPDLAPLANAGRALNQVRRIDRDEVFRLKYDALRRLWAHFAGDDAFDRFVKGSGEPLATFARFCTIAEIHGPEWRDWPRELRHPTSPAVRELAADHADRVRFHQWLQWLLDRQLAAATAEGAQVLHDLAVGFDPSGADAWAWQDVLALDARVGAPPDEFNLDGQDWGLPPFVPWRLRAAGYDPFVQTVRANLSHAGGLRIDHVMGLFRLFWIPPGAPASAGAYVRYRAEELLDILAIESSRAEGFVVGEDLGTVEPGVREVLAGRDVLSYRLLWFEPEPPSRWPEQVLGAVTTHDLPTIAGLWSGADLAAQREMGRRVNADGVAEMRHRLESATGMRGNVPVRDLVVATHRALSASPARLVLGTIDDALGVEERPNLPGTVDGERANWSLALPRSLDEIETDEQVQAVADALRGTDSDRPGR